MADRLEDQVLAEIRRIFKAELEREEPVEPAHDLLRELHVDSLAAVGQRHYPFLPVRLLLKHRFDSAALAPQIRAPLLCIVATHDEVIPPAHAKRLYDAWAGPKRWIALAGAHNETTDQADYWPSVQAFLSAR